MTDKIDVIKTARLQYKDNIRPMLLSSLALCSIGALAVAACFLSPFFGLAVFCLLYLPIAFALEHIVPYYAQTEGASPENRMLFHAAGMYFRLPFFGCYRVLWNVLKSFFGFFLAYFAAMVVTGFILYGTNADFAKDLNALLSLYQSDDEASFFNTLTNSAPLNLWINVGVAAGFGGFFFALECFMGNYMMSPFLRQGFESGPLRLINRYYNRYFDLVGKQYWGLRLKMGLGMPFWSLLAYGAGAALGHRLGLGASGMVAIGSAGMLLLLSLYLPYFFLGANLFFDTRKVMVLHAQLAVTKDLRQSIARFSGDEEIIKQLDEDIRSIEGRIDSFEE